MQINKMWKPMGQLVPTLLRVVRHMEFWKFQARVAEVAEDLSEHCSWTFNSFSPEQVPRLACRVMTKIGITYWDQTKTKCRSSLSHQILISSFFEGCGKNEKVFIFVLVRRIFWTSQPFGNFQKSCRALQQTGMCSVVIYRTTYSWLGRGVEKLAFRNARGYG